MAAKREPWDDDSDSDFQSAASFDLDDSEDEARVRVLASSTVVPWVLPRAGLVYRMVCVAFCARGRPCRAMVE